MKCAKCNTETNNPKFCSRACSAKLTNTFSPKRKPQSTCKSCLGPCLTTRIYCNSCWTKIKTNRSLNEQLGQTTGNKYCPSCKLERPTTAFAKRKDKITLAGYCKSCEGKKATEKHRAFKTTIVKYKGGKCIVCGYNKYIGALDLHHRDPTKKDFRISGKKISNLDTIKDELDKCDLLCANCHRENHARTNGTLL